MSLSRLPVLAACSAVATLSLPPSAASDQAARAVLPTPGLTGQALARTLDRLEAQGVVVPVAVSGEGFLLADRPGLDAAVKRAGLPRPLRDPATLPAFWAPPGPPRPAAEDARRIRAQICAGALDAGEIQRACGVGPRGESGKVHFAAGRCVVNLILPESSGPNSTVDWSHQQQTLIVRELANALDWWSIKTGFGVRFVLVNHGPVPTSEEPGTLTRAQETLYIEDCLVALGYSSTCPYWLIRDLNEATRIRNGAHWAFTQFVLNASYFAGNDPALAYAYLGGPHTVALHGNGNLGPAHLDRVLIHELGHIFQAPDEYSGACACGGAWGYLQAVNDNCVDCPRQESRCIMRGSGEYSAAEMSDPNTWLNMCRHTRMAVGAWDSNGDGIWDVRETRPETRLDTVPPDTLDSSEGFVVTGVAQDMPFAAPPQYDAVTVNRIARVEFTVGGTGFRPAQAADGSFTDTVEDFRVTLPPLGGGEHRLSVRAENTVGRTDISPAQAVFFVYDVRLNGGLDVSPDGPDLVCAWRVDGEDFGSTYYLHRRELGGRGESRIATIASPGGRHARITYRDGDVTAGTEYLYRLEVDIPRKGIRELAATRREATLAPPRSGKIVSFAPNPSRGHVLLAVTVPTGPRPDRPDILIPDRGAGDPLWRDVRLSIHDVRGRLVRDLGTFRQLEAERFHVTWDGTYRSGERASSGVYFVRISLDYEEALERLVLVR